ncbi:MAG: hypothetical protein O6852_08680 [Gammaproteobacteria bacterium]|nr:hypothetical protein [Gammaproteobacteria bacterium]
MEGINVAKSKFPLHFNPKTASPLTIEWSGTIGCEIVPHYIMSMHGTSISGERQNKFGTHTLGVRNIFKLAVELFYKASKQIDVTGYRYGPVSYQYTSLIMSLNGGSSAIGLNCDPPVYVKSIDTNVLRKVPIEPFISQDEWRIVIFPREYLNGDSNEPLKINVDPNNFYEYIKPITNTQAD